jgi:hypothetical protein
MGRWQEVMVEPGAAQVLTDLRCFPDMFLIGLRGGQAGRRNRASGEGRRVRFLQTL